MKNIVLIGSQAAKIHFPEFRPPRDLDFAGKEKIVYSGCEVFSSPSMSWILENFGRVASPDILYTLKLSHIFWKINWKKHADDILFFQRKKCQLIPELFNIAYKDWEILHGKKRAKLTEENKNFFKNTVNRKYDHDSLHLAIAYYERPLFEKIKPDLNFAACSFSLFNTLSFEDKLKLCREEIYVTALERFWIPGANSENPLDRNANVCYSKGLCQLVTSMSKGWFPQFIMENYSYLNRPDKDYVNQFEQGLKKGILC